MWHKQAHRALAHLPIELAQGGHQLALPLDSPFRLVAAERGERNWQGRYPVNYLGTLNKSYSRHSRQVSFKLRIWRHRAVQVHPTDSSSASSDQAAAGKGAIRGESRRYDTVNA